MDLKSVVLGVAIMILTISVVVQGVSVFYDQPEYDFFCSDYGRIPVKEGGNETVCPAVCVEMYGIENNECVFNECGSGCGPDGVNTFRELSQCEIALTGEDCWVHYDAAMENHSRNVFLIALPLGIAIIAAGALIFGLETVGAGLMAGGVGVVLWGVGGFWWFADEWLKFILSLVGLGVLIWLAYYFNRRFGSETKRKKRR
ncbi:MAG: hypothetical protein Q8P81_04630 [Nanoarchaeota archaeon]|nr:hypothetical protein [Nanoarchaeota archaeon]